MASSNPWYVLTGGPGAGKTTVMNALTDKGYRTVPEAARVHIEAKLQEGQTIQEIRGNEVSFQREVLKLKIATEQSLPRGTPIFFDRGLHDSIAYLAVQGVTSDASLVATTFEAHYKKVFHLDMVSFEDDGVRTETIAEALEIHQRLHDVYTEAGIPVERVPVLPVEERVSYILERL